MFIAERTVPIPNKDIPSWIFDDVQYDENKPIYIDPNDTSRSISSRQARVIIRKLVAGFHAAGLMPGDCVCLHSFNDIYYSMLVLGIIAAGGVFTGTNPSYTQHELTHHIKTSRSRFFISEPELLGDALGALKDCKIPSSNVWVFNVHRQLTPPGFKSWDELMKHGEEDWIRFDDEKTSKTTTAARLFSSGTTGLPKAAVISHYNLIAQHTLVHEVAPTPFETKRLLCLPMFHASCVPVSHTTALKSGHVSYVMRRFDLEKWLWGIQHYGINEVAIVPPIVIAIIMSPMTKKYSLKTLKSVLAGAAPLGKDPQKILMGLLPPDATCTQVWGMTETSCISSKFYYPEVDDTGSVGRFMPNIDVKLIDEDGKDITAYGISGELCVRGPIVVAGYFENPEANAESFDAEGFMKTGDIFYCDAESKKWYVVDRKKELIKVRGFQVAPPEIEAILLTHPQIIDCAVIGVVFPSEQDVEHPRAYVVRREGSESQDLSEDTVKKYCAGKLARYKALTGGVVFCDAIPKNASGKILKRILREKAKVELQQERAKL